MFRLIKYPSLDCTCMKLKLNNYSKKFLRFRSQYLQYLNATDKCKRYAKVYSSKHINTIE